MPRGVPLRERGGRHVVRRELQPRARLLSGVALRVPMSPENPIKIQHSTPAANSPILTATARKLEVTVR